MGIGINEEDGYSTQVDETVKAGIRLLSGVVGSAVGFAAGGLPGAMLGGALPAVLEEVSSRLLGKRERERVGAVYLLTGQALQEYINSGMRIRDDGFFSEVPEDDGRAAAEEVVEAVLTAAQHEYEEWKLPYYANLMATIAVRPDFSRSRSVHLVRLAESLSMTQLTIMAIANDPSDKQVLRTTDYTDAGVSVDSPLASLLSELVDLERRNLITFSTNFIIGITAINPSLMKLEGDGVVLHSSMKLERIGPNRREEIKRLLG